MNEKQKKRELDFVLHYYQEGRLDGRKAFRAWSRRVGIGRTVLFRRVVRYAVAACLLLALGASVFVYQWWQENRSVEEKMEQAMAAFDFSGTGYCLDTSPGRLMYFYYDPEQYFKYIRPVRREADPAGGTR